MYHEWGFNWLDFSIKLAKRALLLFRLLCILLSTDKNRSGLSGSLTNSVCLGLVLLGNLNWRPLLAYMQAVDVPSKQWVVIKHQKAENNSVC